MKPHMFHPVRQRDFYFLSNNVFSSHSWSDQFKLVRWKYVTEFSVVRNVWKLYGFFLKKLLGHSVQFGTPMFQSIHFFRRWIQETKQKVVWTHMYQFVGSVWISPLSSTIVSLDTLSSRNLFDSVGVRVYVISLSHVVNHTDWEVRWRPE